MKRFWLYSLAIIYCLLSQSLQGKDPVPFVEAVAETDNKVSIINLHFGEKLGWHRRDVVQTANKAFVQFALPGVTLAESEKFFESKSPYVEKIAAYKNDKGEVTIRMFTKVDGNLVKESGFLEVLDKRLLYTVDHGFIEKRLSSIKAGKALEQQKQVAAAKVPATETSPYLKLKYAAAGLGALLMFLLMFLSWRRFARNIALNKQGGEAIRMELLSSMHISPKQKLSLIQVGGEKILLGIGPEQINVLSRYAPKSAVRAEQRSMVANRASQIVKSKPSGATARATTDSATRTKRSSQSTTNKKPSFTEHLLKEAKVKASQRKLAQKAPSTSTRGTPAKKAAKPAHRPVRYQIDDSGIKADPHARAADDLTAMLRHKVNQMDSE